MNTEARLEREITVRGYELDARGRVRPATLLRYLEGVRWEAIQTIAPVTALFSGGRVTVVRAQRLDVEREVGIGELMIGSMWPGRLGRSSVELRQELRLAPSGALVARAAVVGVHLDETGRPCPLPDALRALGSDQSEWLPIPALVGTPPPSTDFYTETVRVRPRHLDSFRHVNHAQYVDWLDDLRQVGAARAAFGEAGSATAGRLRRLSIEYRREAVLGDELTLVCWPLPGGGIGAEVRRGEEAEALCRARLEVEPL